MKTVTLINASASASLTSPSIGILDDRNSSNLTVWQVIVSATGSVNLQGSLDGTNWVTLGSAVTTSSIVTTTKCPYHRAVITANTGTITVEAAYSS